jgi:hypothetical protein
MIYTFVKMNYYMVYFRYPTWDAGPGQAALQKALLVSSKTFCRVHFDDTT